MKVYRIRRKDTGEFWGGWRYGNEQYWNDKGTFYRTIDNIKHHLDWLCTDQPVPWRRNRIGWLHKKPEKIIHQRMKRYEVVINDITINGEQVIQASEFREQPND